MLLEILITVGVLGVGLLGVAALQVSALRTSQSSVQRGEAAIRISEMTNRMRANIAGVAADNYGRAGTYFSTESCSESTGAAGRACDDIKAWLSEVQTSHGTNTKVLINCSNVNTRCILGVQWDDHRGTPDVNANTASDTAETYSYQSDVVF